MEKIRLLCHLLIILPLVSCQSEQEILDSIGALLNEGEAYRNPTDYGEFNQEPIADAGSYGTYDFVIVGAGSAGTVLANRLSEVRKWKILLIEAGGDDSLASDVPAMAGALQFSRFNWGYQTVPQKTCCQGMVDKKCVAPRGKVLGGSSSINYMIYTRGNVADYDEWAALGNPGWAYKDILPYFKKSENSSLATNVDEAYHGKNGSLHVEHVRHFGKLAQGYLEAKVELGGKILDYNGKDQMGFSRVQSTTINGRRCSGNKAFLKPALSRENLSVVKGAFVTKLLIRNDIQGSYACGVEFVLENKNYFVRTTKEVILSAGAIGSPQILMHSGIGPKEELEALGIPCVNDLAVGKNMHDHPIFLLPFASNYIESGVKPIDQMVSDYSNGHGYFTAAGDVQGIGFVNTDNASSSVPDLEEIVTPFFDLTDGMFRKLFNYNNETFDAYFKPYGAYCGIFLQYLARPKSRGSVKLKSKNHFDHPLIDFNYFSDPQNDDIRIMRKGVRNFLKLAETKALKRFNVTFLENQLPECPEIFLSDAYIECLLRHVTSTLYHQAGTCKMGPATDRHAVVNHELKVWGTQNLRVIDASVFPNPLASHTNAPSYMVAEKGSDLIKKQYFCLNPDDILCI